MRGKKSHIVPNKTFTEFLLYTTPDGKVKVEIFLKDETIWLTQDRIAELFGVQRPAVTKHLKNIFESGELKENVVSSILEQTTPHGAIEGKTQTKAVKFYNLDAIISVGYRVNSKQATQGVCARKSPELPGRSCRAGGSPAAPSQGPGGLVRC